MTHIIFPKVNTWHFRARDPGDASESRSQSNLSYGGLAQEDEEEEKKLRTQFVPSTLLSVLHGIFYLIFATFFTPQLYGSRNEKIATHVKYSSW